MSVCTPGIPMHFKVELKQVIGFAQRVGIGILMIDKHAGDVELIRKMTRKNETASIDLVYGLYFTMYGVCGI